MRVRILTFRYSPTLGAFDDGPLVEFLRDKEVLAFREHFFAVNDVPHVACVVSYQAHSVAGQVCPSEAPPRRSSREQGMNPLQGLSEGERILYETIREWRSARARQEGVPPYVLLTNRELAEIVKRRPANATALGHVPGIGRAKIERYGRELLALLGGIAEEVTPASGACPSREPS